MTVTWLLQAAFLITMGTSHIYIDPYDLPKGLPKADYIFITHPHYDHLSIKDIRKIISLKTIIVAPKTVKKDLVWIWTKKFFVSPGNEYKLKSFRITTVPMYNLTNQYHLRENNWCGYVIQFTNGLSFFHTGDSDNIPEYESLRDLHITVMAVSCGGTYTMNSTNAAEACKTVMPGEVIPMHWGEIVGSSTNAETVRQLLKDTDIKVRIMKAYSPVTIPE